MGGISGDSDGAVVEGEYEGELVGEDDGETEGDDVGLCVGECVGCRETGDELGGEGARVDPGLSVGEMKGNGPDVGTLVGEVLGDP